MSRRKSTQNHRGTTLIEILVSVALLLIIFLFVTLDLIQSSDAENVSATTTTAADAANYMLGIMRSDPNFWNTNHWNSGPGGPDQNACNIVWAPYTDSIVNPTWHAAPACTANGNTAALFPEFAGMPSDGLGLPAFAYMWNAQNINADPNLAQLTVWVRFNEGGRTNVYELDGTRGNVVAAPLNSPILPTPAGASPTPCQTNCSTMTMTPTPTPHPHPSPSPTSTPSHTPTPTPTPSGLFE